MRAAAPVDAVIGDARVERSIAALLYAAAGAGAVATLGAAWPTIGVGAVVCAVLGRLAWPVAPGRLRWDGQGWSVADADGAFRPIAAPRLCIDAGGWVLLRLNDPSRRAARWAGLRRSDTAARWHDLRVALVAHGHERSGPEASR